MVKVIDKRTFVMTLNKEQQKEVENELRRVILNNNDYSNEEVEQLIEDGLNSRIGDLEDSIDIYNLKLISIQKRGNDNE